jgi:hypothetical protein
MLTAISSSLFKRCWTITLDAGLGRGELLVVRSTRPKQEKAKVGFQPSPMEGKMGNLGDEDERNALIFN